MGVTFVLPIAPKKVRHNYALPRRHGAEHLTNGRLRLHRKASISAFEHIFSNIILERFFIHNLLQLSIEELLLRQLLQTYQSKHHGAQFNSVQKINKYK